MNPDWLSQLAPDRAPPPLAWWHLAPGWWGVVGLGLIALLAAAWALRRWRAPAARWQRTALRELAQMQTERNDATLAQGLQYLLRRYALLRYGRDAVAPLGGEAWLAFVVAHGGSAWAGEPGHHLLRCAYGSSAAAPATCRERWLAGARGFLQAQARA